jgi:hypothetical protein
LGTSPKFYANLPQNGKSVKNKNFGELLGDINRGFFWHLGTFWGSDVSCAWFFFKYKNVCHSSSISNFFQVFLKFFAGLFSIKCWDKNTCMLLTNFIENICVYIFGDVFFGLPVILLIVLQDIVRKRYFKRSS